MKTLRRLVKLFVPYGLLRRWAARRYGERWPEVGSGAASRWLHACLPTFVAAIDSRRRGEDRRPIKYWLPYGRMRRHVTLHYGLPLRDEGAFPAWVRGLRAACPYGLILWWDAETHRTRPRPAPAPKPSRPAPAPAQGVGGPALREELRALRAEVAALREDCRRRDERLEALALRLLLELRRKEGEE